MQHIISINNLPCSHYFIWLSVLVVNTLQHTNKATAMKACVVTLLCVVSIHKNLLDKSTDQCLKPSCGDGFDCWAFGHY